MELEAKHYGEKIIFFWYNQKVNSSPQFQRSQIFYCKVEEQNTQNFLQSKMVSVLTRKSKKWENKSRFRRLNHLRKGTDPEY